MVEESFGFASFCRARQLQTAHTALLHAGDYHIPELCIEKAKYIREQVNEMTFNCGSDIYNKYGMYKELCYDCVGWSFTSNGQFTKGNKVGDT